MERKTVYVGIIGVGCVGSCFMSQLTRLAGMPSTYRLVLCYLGIIDKTLYTPDYSDIGIDGALNKLEAQGEAPWNFQQVADYLGAAPSRVILVDNTSSQSLAKMYPTFLGKGVSIVTPNKKAFSGGYKLWQDVFESASNFGSFIFHESSVGAGLPIISTIKDLRVTGDHITRIEGIFSGTLSYLLNSFSPLNDRAVPTAWSDEVRKAKDLGFTEPDPRDDLNGLDVARKLTILSRLAGLAIESTASFPTQSLIPEELDGSPSAESFMRELPKFDQQMHERRLECKHSNKVLRYVATADLTSGMLKVGLEQVDKSNMLAQLTGSDNVFIIYTKRYGERPLVIQGAGAGGEVTAMGVLSDFIKILERLRL